MKNSHFYSLLATALISMTALGTTMNAASAETVTTQTTVVQSDIPGVEKINFSQLDLNNDGILSRAEVARKLFYLFDGDGNEVIDNIEIKKNRVLTFIPLEKTQLTMIDFNDDGLVDKTHVSNEEFMKFSMLSRFDKDMDGLNAQDFIGKSFLELDTDNSKAVEAREWRDAYIKSVAPLVAKQYRYN